jgi:cytochrome c553
MRRVLVGPARGTPARRLGIAVAATVLLAAAAPPPGATSCSGCHGGVDPLPKLAGRPSAEITAALAEYRAGTRPATLMNRIAKGFTPDESAAIAAWWSAHE